MNGKIVIICECTEFPDTSPIETQRHHTHLSKLEKIILENNDKQWILIILLLQLKKI